MIINTWCFSLTHAADFLRVENFCPQIPLYDFAHHRSKTAIRLELFSLLIIDHMGVNIRRNNLLFHEHLDEQLQLRVEYLAFPSCLFNSSTSTLFFNCSADHLSVIDVDG